MPISGIEEPQALSDLQRHSMNIPIKKRRFPIVRSESPPEVETKRCGSAEIEFQDKQDLGVLDNQFPKSTMNAESSSGCDASKISNLIVKSEREGSHVDAAETNTDVFASVAPQQEKPCVCLGFADDAMKKMDVLSKGKNPVVSDVPQSDPAEGNSELETLQGRTDAGLSIRSKDSLVLPTVKEQEEEIGCKSGKSDTALSSLSSCKELPVMVGKSDGDRNQTSSVVCSDRSYWDLNTTMDVWLGSTNSDALTNSSFDNTEVSTIDACRHDSKSFVITSSTAELYLNKGKSVLDEYRSDISITSEQPNLQPKVDFFPGFRVENLPYGGMNSVGDHSATLNKLLSVDVSPNLRLQLAQLPATYLNLVRCPTVKSEPVDQNSKPESSLSSSCSSNIELSNTGSVKRELIENHCVEAAMPSPSDVIRNRIVLTPLCSSMSPQGPVEHRSIKSELGHEANQESCTSKVVESKKSMGRVMQHQESCVSSSILPMSLMPTDLCRSTSSLCSNQTMNEDLVNHLEKISRRKETDDHENVLHRTVDAMISEPFCESGKASTQYKVENSKSGDAVDCNETWSGDHFLGLGKVANIAANHEEKTSLAKTTDKASSESDLGSHESHVDVRTIRRQKTSTKDDEYEDGEIREPLRNSAGEVVAVERKKIDRKDQCDDIRSSQSSVPLNDQVAKESGCVKDVTSDRQPDESQEIAKELGNKARDNTVKDIPSRNEDSTLVVPEASPKCNDLAKDSKNTGSVIESNNTGNKSRIINLPRSFTATTLGKSKFIPNRLFTSKRARDNDANIDGEIMPRGRRNEIYSGGANRFEKDEIHDQSLRRSGPYFRHEKRTISGRFGSAQNDWDIDQDFASEAHDRPHDNRVARHRYTSSISEFEREPYNNGDNTLNTNRRRTLNESIPSFRRSSLRRPSPGDIDLSVNRDIQKRMRIPRNTSPSHCNTEDSSTFVGFRHSDKFLRRLSSDSNVNSVYNRSRAMFNAFDDQMLRGNRRFSPMQRKGFPRMRSKSPIRSRTRSPGPCTISPRRRPQDSHPENRSPPVYRRMRSPPDRVFRDEIVPRRRASSPLLGARHLSDLRDIENMHYRNVNPNNRRSSPPIRLLRRNTRKGDDMLDSREMGDGDEFMGGSMQHPEGGNYARGHDSCIEERRKLFEKREHSRSFRPSYNDDNDDETRFRFREYAERNNDDNVREFEGRMKRQISRRIRGGIDEQQDGNYRPSGRVWCDEDFTEVSGIKRRRY